MNSTFHVGKDHHIETTSTNSIRQNSNVNTKSVNDDLPKSNYNLVDEWGNDESSISDDLRNVSNKNCSRENKEIIDDHSIYNNNYDVNNLLLPPANRQFVTLHENFYLFYSLPLFSVG